MGAKSSSGSEGTETQQSSVLFSLKELAGIEAERVEEERRAAATRESAKAQQRAEALERERADYEARRANDRARRQEEESRCLQESVRHEAIRIAAMEKTRLEVVERSRIAIMAETQEHERKLLALANDAEKRQLRRTIVTVALLGVLAVATALGVYFGGVRPGMIERERALAAEAAQRASEAEHLRAEGADRDAKLRALQAERNAPLPDPPPPPPVVTVAPKRTSVIKPPPLPTSKPCVKNSDPLNGCLH